MVGEREAPMGHIHALVYGHLIGLDKHPKFRPVGVGETWQRMMSKYMLKVDGQE